MHTLKILTFAICLSVSVMTLLFVAGLVMHVSAFAGWLCAVVAVLILAGGLLEGTRI